MTGWERAERIYREYAEPRLQAELPEALPRAAAGLCGHGSECFGFDDQISLDHDFTAGFSWWLTAEDDRKYGIALRKLYARIKRELPPDLQVTSAASRFGETDEGVQEITAFYRRHLGLPGAPSTVEEWLNTPEYALCEAVNGKIFRDDAGVFTAIRRQILEGMPESVWRHKLAGALLTMAQSGQYNFPRCRKHGEYGAAALALTDFVRATARTVYLLNRRFPPYFKWLFRGMRPLEVLGELSQPLEFLLTDGKLTAEEKTAFVEEICGTVTGELRRQQLSVSEDSFLEAQAESVRAGITDRKLRDLPLFG